MKMTTRDGSAPLWPLPIRRKKEMNVRMMMGKEKAEKERTILVLASKFSGSFCKKGSRDIGWNISSRGSIVSSLKCVRQSMAQFSGFGPYSKGFFALIGQ